MTQAFSFPATIEAALHELAGYNGRARVIAGGTDLVMQLQSGEVRAEALVDVSRIAPMREVTLREGLLYLGAGVTHAELAASPLVKQNAPLLAIAALEVGSAQIRNTGTLGGNVVNAQPAADTALALLALDAEAEIYGPLGERWMPVASLYNPSGGSRVDSRCEILTRFRLPAAQPGCGSAYRRLGKCKSIALPVNCAAAAVRMDGDRFAAASIALGPVAPVPLRALPAEEWLVGKSATEETIMQAARLARQAAHPRDSLLRCSRDYRESQVEVIVRSVLLKAVIDARGSQAVETPPYRQAAGMGEAA